MLECESVGVVLECESVGVVLGWAGWLVWKSGKGEERDFRGDAAGSTRRRTRCEANQPRKTTSKKLFIVIDSAQCINRQTHNK